MTTDEATIYWGGYILGTGFAVWLVGWGCMILVAAVLRRRRRENEDEWSTLARDAKKTHRREKRKKVIRWQ